MTPFPALPSLEHGFKKKGGKHRPRKGKDKEVQHSTPLGNFDLLADMLHKFAHSASGFYREESTRSAQEIDIKFD